MLRRRGYNINEKSSNDEISLPKGSLPTSSSHGINKKEKASNRTRNLIVIMVLLILSGLAMKFNLEEKESDKTSFKKHSESKNIKNGKSDVQVQDTNDINESNKEIYLRPLDKNFASTDTVHLIFSTDCSDFQQWQSYSIAYSAFVIGQHDIGTITRIASGCNNEAMKKIKQWHDEHIRDVFGDRYLIHFTPHFSSVKGADGKVKGDYKFFNKPLGVRHWLETNANIPDKDIVALLDPDMLLLKRISGDFSVERDVIFSGKAKDDNRKFKVEEGTPFGQHYGLGAQWRTFNLSHIAGTNSPAKEVSQSDAFKYYPVGPPYIAAIKDFRNIVQAWCEFVPKVHAEYPYLLAEMFAYCIAAAHLQLPHMRIDNLMVSNTGAGGEGWPFVDAVKDDEKVAMCDFATAPISDLKYPIPSVIHYCQRYLIGSILFSKRKFDRTFYACDTKPLESMPSDLAEKSIKPDDDEKTKTKINRESFMLCTITSILNDSLSFYKDHHCKR